ncbi:ATP-binding protein [Nocardioides sp. Kera G14]|uniref:sensor histidine kinase n=1 Tax=Nocardioides sp. Kera G14 TaxID=2884264 RepID=UPI001D11B5C7|nr:ATP-binding protein [Nocardioides sp. Kera G14]UDY24612.1 GHKL domain-containing protein [Nocardioides sp. Kera G14]
MLRPSHRRWTFSARNVAFLVGLLLAVVLLLLAGGTLVLRHDLSQEYEERALAIARSVAQEPGLADEVRGGGPTVDGPVQRAAERVRRGTGALYVVVTDRRGVRYSHPNEDNVGELVSTSPDAALAGRDVALVERGTLGMSARGKVPLRTDDGRIVGEVSVGISMGAVNARTRQLLLVLGLVALGALAVGVLGAVSQGRRLRRTTLGLEPEEMADLVREHAAVLGGIRDGIIAVDAHGRVTVVNGEARRLLGVAPERGVKLKQAGLPEVIEALLLVEPAPAGTTCVLGDRVVVAHRIAVRRDGHDLGHVLTLRDRTDLDDAARELEATRALTDALRAQHHEHRNRLHALGGLLHLGHVDQAGHYLEELTCDLSGASGVGEPYLAGLLAAKAALASEAGVRIDVSGSYVDGVLTAPLDVVTVLGNLIDNAVRAAGAGPRRPAEVHVTAVSDGRDLVLHVADSGDGVPPEDVGRIFRQGFTTRESGTIDHGIGLSVARLTARAHGGDVTLADPGGPLAGASFTARLRDVLAPAPQDELSGATR